MRSTTSLVSQLQHDLPDLTFSQGDRFYWSPKEHIIYYENTDDTGLLLHEVAHAILNHTNYRYDVELIKMEREAWDLAATTLAKKYDVNIKSDAIETMLNTYRDWLHDRSLCPNCDATGIQIATHRYSCLVCDSIWRVNEARVCALRRYKLPASSKRTKK